MRAGKAVAALDFVSFADTVPAALDACGAAALLRKQRRVLIKPNLVNASPPPVTTPAECCEAVLLYVRKHAPKAEVIIAEGCGDVLRETPELFAIHGYDMLSGRHDVGLLDLNHAPCIRVEVPGGEAFPELWLPEVAFTHFLVSVPVLKAHSLADMTGALKNLMGLLPPERYGQGGAWKKSSFHGRMQESLRDLARCRTPDLCLVDASVGLAEHHLGGRRCDPPLCKLLAGRDALEVDRAGAKLLGLDWRDIGHLRGDNAQGRRDAP